MSEQYYIGQIFEDDYAPEVAKWCNENKCMIVELERVEDKRRFEIQKCPEPTEEQLKQSRIAELKYQLNSTDYKIVKCSECSLAGEELPYDIAALHAQRQALRDEINELENA